MDHVGSMIEVAIVSQYRSVAHFCEVEGLPYQTVMNWIHGRSKPRKSARELLRRKLGLVWSETGTAYFVAPVEGGPIETMVHALRSNWELIPEKNRNAAMFDFFDSLAAWAHRHGVRFDTPAKKRR
jgi:hypothetical protein